MPRTISSLDPNDPQNKLMNDRRFYAALMESIIADNRQHVWRMEGWKLAMRNEYLRQKSAEMDPTKPTAVFGPPSPTETRRTEEVLKTLKETLENIVAKTAEKAVAAIKAFFGNAPQNAAISAKAQAIAAKVYSPTLPQQAATLYNAATTITAPQAVSQTKEAMLNNVPEGMQIHVGQLLATMFSATDPHLGLALAMEVSAAMRYSAEAKAATAHLEEAESRTQLAQLVAVYHEVLTPLNRIMGAEFANATRDSAHDMQDLLVEEVMGLPPTARTEAGIVLAGPKPTDGVVVEQATGKKPNAPEPPESSSGAAPKTH